MRSHKSGTVADRTFAVFLSVGGSLLAVPASAGTTGPTTSPYGYMADALRLETNTFRLETSISDLCEETHMLTGLMLHDISGFSATMRPAAIRAYGLTYGFGVTQIVPGSPAEQAGIRQGDEIVAVNGYDLQDFMRNEIGKKASYLRTEGFSEYLGEALEHGPAVLTIRRGSKPVTILLSGEPGCGGRPVLLQKKKLNAWSNGEYVAVTTKMLRFAESDSELAFVIAHEIAHNILHNGKSRNQKSKARALLNDRSSRSKSIEIEADDLAIDLLARAGYDLSAPEGFFRRVSKVRKFDLALTHPSNSRRIRNVNEAVARYQVADNIQLASNTFDGTAKSNLARITGIRGTASSRTFGAYAGLTLTSYDLGRYSNRKSIRISDVPFDLRSRVSPAATGRYLSYRAGFGSGIGSFGGVADRFNAYSAVDNGQIGNRKVVLNTTGYGTPDRKAAIESGIVGTLYL